MRSIMRKYGLKHQEKDVTKNPAFRMEMEQRSGQSLAPCVEIDGQMLADVSGAEVENWLLAHGYIGTNDTAPDAPIDSCCSAEAHDARKAGRLPVPGKIRFLG